MSDVLHDPKQTHNLCWLDNLSTADVVETISTRGDAGYHYTMMGGAMLALRPEHDTSLDPIKAQDVSAPGLDDLAGLVVDRVKGCQNQSIIIRGNSGSGKSFSAGHLLARITDTLDHKIEDGDNTLGSQINRFQKVIGVFGNASTPNNSDSSRFGKLLELHVGGPDHQRLVGAEITVYLLEQIRVPCPPTGESNMHILHLLAEFGARIGLVGEDLLPAGAKFAILPDRQGEYQQEVMEQVVDTIHLICTSDEADEIWRLLIALLYLGNVAFDHSPPIAVKDLAEHDDLKVCSQLLRVTPTTLAVALRAVSLGRAPDNDKSARIRDGVIMTIFRDVFEFLVGRMNKTMASDTAAGTLSISLVDIFGLESIEKNSLSQLHINTANEMLVEMFLRDVAESVPHDHLSDDQDHAVDLETETCEIVKTILGHLDTTSGLAGRTNADFVALVRNLSQHTKHVDVKGRSILIHHFGQTWVDYETEGLLELNRLSPPKDAIQALTGQHNASHILTRPSPGSARQLATRRYLRSLEGLRLKLDASEVLWLHCLRRPQMPSHPSLLEQIASIGGSQAIQSLVAGFPRRLTHSAFIAKYGDLAEDALHASAKQAIDGVIAGIAGGDAHLKAYRLTDSMVLLTDQMVGLLDDALHARLPAPSPIPCVAQSRFSASPTDDPPLPSSPCTPTPPARPARGPRFTMNAFELMSTPALSRMDDATGFIESQSHVSSGDQSSAIEHSHQALLDLLQKSREREQDLKAEHKRALQQLDAQMAHLRLQTQQQLEQAKQEHDTWMTAIEEKHAVETEVLGQEVLESQAEAARWAGCLVAVSGSFPLQRDPNLGEITPLPQVLASALLLCLPDADELVAKVRALANIESRVLSVRAPIYYWAVTQELYLRKRDPELKHVADTLYRRGVDLAGGHVIKLAQSAIENGHEEANFIQIVKKHFGRIQSAFESFQIDVLEKRLYEDMVLDRVRQGVEMVGPSAVVALVRKAISALDQ